MKTMYCDCHEGIVELQDNDVDCPICGSRLVFISKTISKSEFKAQISTMTKEQKARWNEIYSKLVTEVNDMEIKSKARYKSEINAAYLKAIFFYLNDNGTQIGCRLP